MLPFLSCLTFFFLIASATAEEAAATSKLPEEILKARAAIDSGEVDEAFKAPALEALEAAEAKLAAAAKNRARTETLRTQTPNAPATIKRLERELKELPEKPETPRLPPETEALRGLIESRKAEAAELATQVESRNRALASLKARPIEIGERLPKANAELAAKKAELEALGQAAGESLAASANRLRLRAEIEALEAEVAMLGQEQNGQSSREKIAALELQLAERMNALATTSLATIEAELAKRIEDDLQKFSRRVESAVAQATEPTLGELAQTLPLLLALLEETSGRSQQAARLATEQQDKLETLQRDKERLTRQAELGGLDGAYAQVMLDQRRRLPNRYVLDATLKDIDDQISAARLEGFKIDELRAEQASLEKKWTALSEAAPLLALRTELLSELAEEHRALIRSLTRRRADLQAYRDLSAAFADVLTEQLFWRRSSPPIGRAFFRDLPDATAQALAQKRWAELGQAIASVPTRHPFAASLVAAALLAWFGLRRRLRQTIDHSATKIRRISTDHLGHTLRALLASLVFVLPVPLLMVSLAQFVRGVADVGPWVHGFSEWLAWAGFSLFGIFWLHELARDGGVGRRHFGWADEICDLLRRLLQIVAVLLLAGMLVPWVTILQNDARQFDTIGRLGLIVTLVGSGFAFAWSLRSASKGFVAYLEKNPKGWLARGRLAWMLLLVGTPAALALITGLGYSITVLFLTAQFQVCLAWIAGGVIFYGVLLRWFTIRERRIALAEALEARRARREKADASEPTGSEEMQTTDDEDDVELDLEAVSRQTRRLLRSLVGIGVVVAICYSVAAALPLQRTAGDITIFGNFSLLALLRAILAGAITWTVAKNLPGILDLAGLRQSGIAPGTRYALATLCQYAVALVGIIWLTRELSVDWARFGWIAAALSVGLGFGLQEIVANFVCGIIILFERPIRVGDVVTIGNVTGKVSKIRMRATTITNWERQEFLVPNKEFITGSLINWTLSSALNRVSIPIGVAYGTDTVLARRILTEIAEAHPLILADPAPSITFDAFGDSTLDLTLRFFLPDLENRLTVITEVNEAIDRRYKEAGIEIAFPQRDLHLRSVPEAFLPGRSQSPAES